MITFKIAVIAFKALHGSEPDYTTELIKPYTPVDSYDLQTNCCFLNLDLIVRPMAAGPLR